MNTEKIYVMVPAELGWRVYTLNEVVRLWRSAQLPRDAEFQNDSGEWRPIGELLNPIIEREIRTLTTSSAGTPAAKVSRRFQGGRSRWVWAGLGVIVLVTLLFGWLTLRDRYLAQKTRQQEEQEVFGLERERRMEDFIKSGEVVPGMTLEQVRRSWGEPKAMKTTADASKGQWVYRKGVVVFENGTVIGVEAPRR